MKPLELTVYPKMGSVYYDDEANCTWSETMVYGLSVEKRLTDAELAAEWHRQDGYTALRLEGYSVANDGYEFGSEYAEVDHLATLHRFATLPHHDEATL